MNVNLTDIIIEIENYNKILRKYEFTYNGVGQKTWSHQWIKNEEKVDVRMSDWTYYKNDVEILTGKGSASLERYLDEIVYRGEENWIN